MATNLFARPPTAPPAESTAADYEAALTAARTLDGYPWRPEVRRRRTTLGVTVEPDATIVLTIPPTMGPERVVAAVRKKRDTILRHHFAALENAPRHAVKELVSGEGFDWLGRPHRLRITDEPGSVRRDVNGHGKWIIANRADLAARGAEPLIDWYRAEALTWSVERAAHWMPRLGLAELPVIRMRPVSGGRWGRYLPASHTVDVHWALFQLPVSLVELVLVDQLVRATRPASPAELRVRFERVMPCAWQERKRLVEAGRFVWMGDVVSRTADGS